MDRKKLHIIYWLILCLAALRGLIYCVAIPFDQAPDEKHHFALIKAKQLELAGASADTVRQEAARYESTWMSLLHPEASPTSGTPEDAEYGFPSSLPPSSQFYYFVTANILHRCSLERMRDEIYLMRGVSIVCGVLVVGIAALIARELFPSDRFLCVGIPVFITFVPQFSAMNGVISNDKFAEVFAALLFWMLVKMFKEEKPWQYGAAYLLVMGFALFSKRTTYFLLPISLLLVFLWRWKGRIGFRMHVALFAGIMAMIGLMYGLLWIPTLHLWVHDHIISIPEARELPRAVFRPELFTGATLLHIAKFLTVMYWGFWGIFGYLTIHLHHFWYVAAACVQGVALIGLGRLTIRAKRRRCHVEFWKARVYYLFGASIVLSLLIPVFRSIILLFGEPDLTQGRYLFTVMIPISVFTMLGVAALCPAKYRRFVGGAGLFAMIALDSSALLHYILLNFQYVAIF